MKVNVALVGFFIFSILVSISSSTESEFILHDPKDSDSKYDLEDFLVFNNLDECGISNGVKSFKLLFTDWKQFIILIVHFHTASNSKSLPWLHDQRNKSVSKIMHHRLDDIEIL